MSDSPGFTVGSVLVGPVNNEIEVLSIHVRKGVVDGKWDTMVKVKVTNPNGDVYEMQTPAKELIVGIDRGDTKVIKR